MNRVRLPDLPPLKEIVIITYISEFTTKILYGKGWEYIDSRPTSENAPFVVLCKTENYGFVEIQVSNFQGDMYPDYLDLNIDYSDRVVGAVYWRSCWELPEEVTL